MKIYNEDILVIIVDKDFNIIRLNEKAKKEYGEVAGQKCYSVFNGFNQPCYRATQYICPIKILLDTGSDRYTGVYSLSSKPGKYVVITVERDGDYFVHTHRILDRHQLELIDFKKIFNFLSEGLALIDKKTKKVKFLNSQFLKIFEIDSDGDGFLDRDIAYLNRELPDEIKGIFYRDEMIP
ncbi:MAG: PAS domain-containing protein, partial [Aquificae bacterium]|nr:PAS domain-containing protein [Aquificota bacterium]